jgi:hypothetical protein
MSQARRFRRCRRKFRARSARDRGDRGGGLLKEWKIFQAPVAVRGFIACSLAAALLPGHASKKESEVHDDEDVDS